MLVGGGVRLAGGIQEMTEFLKLSGFPMVTSWSGFDAVPHSNPLLVGQFGVYGNRGANFAVQNADLLISVGSRLDTRQTGGRPALFARNAKRVMVDIDQSEIKKRRGFTPHIEIVSDAKDFLISINRELKAKKFHSTIEPWKVRARMWKEKYPACLPEYYKAKGKICSTRLT